MMLFSILFALVMLALWGAAVVGMWVTTGFLGGLAFTGVTLAIARLGWGSNKPVPEIVGWHGRQPIFEDEACERCQDD